MFSIIVSVLDKILSILPIQKRVERWKNELDELKKERALLLEGKCDARKAERIINIDQRIDLLNQWLRNSANDS